MRWPLKRTPKVGSREPAFGVKLIHEQKIHTTRLYTKSIHISTGFTFPIEKIIPEDDSVQLLSWIVEELN